MLKTFIPAPSFPGAHKKKSYPVRTKSYLLENSVGSYKPMATAVKIVSMSQKHNFFSYKTYKLSIGATFEKYINV